MLTSPISKKPSSVSNSRPFLVDPNYILKIERLGEESPRNNSKGPPPSAAGRPAGSPSNRKALM